MRRHLGGRVAQQRPAVERHRLAGRARQVRRRDPRAWPRGPTSRISSPWWIRRSGRPASRPTSLDAIAFTRGPGLVGSLLVGVSFAKGLSIARNIPMVEVNHPGTHPLAFHRPAGPAIAPPVIPVPLPAGERRAHANRARGLPDPNADHRHDDRRRRGRSVRQVRQGDGAAPTRAVR